MFANAVMSQNPYAKRLEVNMVSFFPHLSAIKPPMAVPGIDATANSVAGRYHMKVFNTSDNRFCPTSSFCQVKVVI